MWPAGRQSLSSLRSLCRQPVAMAARHDSTSAMPRRLTGKVAIVTASTDGIGLAIARRLAQEGARVAISSRKEANVTRTVDTLRSEGLDVLGVPCHVGKDEQRKQLLDTTLSTWGQIDILVSNAAVNPVFGPTLEACDGAAWDKIFDINVKCAFLLAKEAYPHMRQQSTGRIIFVSSIAAFTPLPGLGPYSVSKTALLGLAKVLARELGDDNITVNCLAPGIVDTRFSSALTKSDAGSKITEQTSLGRVAVPEDMAGTVAFLASDDARYITGETIVNAGGMTSHL
ncbi:dehydrogenase/reductase SDR family member 4-like [Sycon ciliatum]|uniref:dehydrogenase/reductase SDR family member 4-like n=1 Tax=Sycon ciliatum TaxID=27933 RepID=UPI0031F642CB